MNKAIIREALEAYKNISIPAGWEEDAELADKALAELDVIEPKPTEIICPFCGDDDFDKVGLKLHLENYCEIYPGISLQEKQYEKNYPKEPRDE